MEEIVIQAKHRDLIGEQVKNLRRQGQIPAVLYGKSVAPVPVALDYRVISKL